jgi:hypothetical protein
MPMAHTRIRFALFVTAVAATTCVNSVAAQRIPAEAWANADRRISTILVFRQGRTPPFELATAPDANFLQGLGGATIGFSRVISVATPRFIRRASAAARSAAQPAPVSAQRVGPLPTPLDHDGIDDAFAGKGSTVHYFHSGRWVTLAGSD